MSYGAKQYKKTAVKTASREQVLLMLYEAAIRNIKKAKEEIQNKNISEKGKSIGKAHDIINELSNTLNFEVGGEIAVELERLYNFCTEQLVKANLDNAIEPLDAVQKVLENLLDGWKGAIEQLKTEGKAG